MAGRGAQLLDFGEVDEVVCDVSGGCGEAADECWGEVGVVAGGGVGVVT